MNGRGGGVGVRFTAFQDPLSTPLTHIDFQDHRNAINIDDMHVDCKDKNHFQCMQTLHKHILSISTVC